ncbi:MAG: HIT domain-containing protein [Anaerolineaceae bacterium]|nr:HIT domain-containing protein [Anaerolineaceae bacterium]
MPTIFAKIIAKEIPASIVYQDELVTAFKDINPVAPVHILIVPNVEIASTNDVLPEHEQMLGHLFTVAKQVAKEQGVAESGYRLIVNNGSDSGQEVPHLHIHLIGGRKLGPLLQARD